MTGPSTEMLARGVAIALGMRSTSQGWFNSSADVGRSLGFLNRQPGGLAMSKSKPQSLSQDDLSEAFPHSVCLSSAKLFFSRPARNCQLTVTLKTRQIVLHDRESVSRKAVEPQQAHLLKQQRRKSLPSLDSRGGMTGGSLVDAMWNSAATCTCEAIITACVPKCSLRQEDPFLRHT